MTKQYCCYNYHCHVVIINRLIKILQHYWRGCFVNSVAGWGE